MEKRNRVDPLRSWEILHWVFPCSTDTPRLSRPSDSRRRSWPKVAEGKRTKLMWILLYYEQINRCKRLEKKNNESNVLISFSATDFLPPIITPSPLSFSLTPRLKMVHFWSSWFSIHRPPNLVSLASLETMYHELQFRNKRSTEW